jgi:hypothetical protein
MPRTPRRKQTPIKDERMGSEEHGVSEIVKQSLQLSLSHFLLLRKLDH